MERKTETRKLVVELDEHALLERGREQSKLLLEVTELKSKKSALTAKIKPKDERISELATVIEEEKEIQEVECEWHYDWERNVKRLYRTDTQDMVQEDNIADWERQMHMSQGDA